MNFPDPCGPNKFYYMSELGFDRWGEIGAAPLIRGTTSGPKSGGCEAGLCVEAEPSIREST